MRQGKGRLLQEEGEDTPRERLVPTLSTGLRATSGRLFPMSCSLVPAFAVCVPGLMPLEGPVPCPKGFAWRLETVVR